MDSVLRDYFSDDSESFNSYTIKSHSLSREVDSWKKIYSEVLGKNVKKILNVGCGPGTEAILLAKMGFEVTALDFSPRMIEHTEINSQNAGVTVKTIVGDAENLPFETEEFDAVVSNYALWAVPNPQKAIDGWMKVLKKGGKVAYIDGIWSTEDYSRIRKIWVKFALHLRSKDGNSHIRISSKDEEGRLSQLWSKTAERPKQDLNMMQRAGFDSIRVINKIDRRIFSGKRYIEYGYHKVHFMITGLKP